MDKKERTKEQYNAMMRAYFMGRIEEVLRCEFKKETQFAKIVGSPLLYESKGVKFFAN